VTHDTTNKLSHNKDAAVLARQQQHTSVHKPRPGQTSRDPRLVAREEREALAKKFAAQTAAAIPKARAGQSKTGVGQTRAERSARRLLSVAHSDGSNGGYHRKHRYQMMRFRGTSTLYLCVCVCVCAYVCVCA